MLSCCCYQRLLHNEHGVVNQLLYLVATALQQALLSCCSCQRSVWLDCWSKSVRRIAPVPK